MKCIVLATPIITHSLHIKMIASCNTMDFGGFTCHTLYADDPIVLRGATLGDLLPDLFLAQGFICIGVFAVAKGFKAIRLSIIPHHFKYF